MAFLDTAQPLMLPEGSVRALVTIMLVASLIGFYVYLKWAPPTIETLTVTAFGFYFGARQPQGANGNGGNGNGNGAK